jgi:hypothetical protein
MIRLLLSVITSICVTTGLLALMRWVFGVQARRFNDRVARDFLADWQGRLELLDPAERERVMAAPPANVLEAMTMVEPSRAWRRGSVDRPTSRI